MTFLCKYSIISSADNTSSYSIAEHHSLHGHMDFFLVFFQGCLAHIQFVADITFFTNTMRICHVLPVAVILLQLCWAYVTLVLWVWSFVRVAVIHVPLQVRCSFEFLSTLLTLVQSYLQAEFLCMIEPAKSSWIKTTSFLKYKCVFFLKKHSGVLCNIRKSYRSTFFIITQGHCALLIEKALVSCQLRLEIVKKGQKQCLVW